MAITISPKWLSTWTQPQLQRQWPGRSSWKESISHCDHGGDGDHGEDGGNGDDGDGEDGDGDDDDPGKATGLGLFLFHMSKVSQLQMDDNSMEKWGEIQWKGRKYNEMEEIQLKWRKIQRNEGKYNNSRQ